MLALPDVTLCCVDTANHALALRALRLSTKDIAFARALLLTTELPPGVAAVVVTDVGLIIYHFGKFAGETSHYLVYTRLNGIAYGTPVLVLGKEETTPAAAPSLGVSPNPLRDTATLHFTLAVPEQLLDLALQRVDAQAELLEHGDRAALGLSQQGAQQVRGLDLGVTSCAREVLGLGERFLALDGELVETHGTRS